METAGTDYYLNLDFDLSLREGWSSPDSGEMPRLIADMGLHAWLVGTAHGDRILSRAMPDEELLTHLESHGIEIPQIADPISPRSDGRFEPMGWNREAAAMNQRRSVHRSHPDLDVVRRVNSRRFSLSIERSHFDAGPEFESCDSLRDVERHLVKHPRSEGWVIKGDHGNSGFANKRVRGANLSNVDRKVIERLIAECGAVVVEPWLPRMHDLCCVYSVDRDAGLKDFHVHEVVNSADGAFIGSLLQREGPLHRRWEDEIREAAGRVARALAQEGYYGPACQDALVWDDDGVPRLRPLVDLNARSFISAGALRQWKIWECRGLLYWRTFPRRRLRLPNSLAKLVDALDENAYDIRAEEGILPVTGLSFQLGDRRLDVGRVGVLLRHRSRSGISSLERRFRELFER